MRKKTEARESSRKLPLHTSSFHLPLAPTSIACTPQPISIAFCGVKSTLICQVMASKVAAAAVVRVSPAGPRHILTNRTGFHQDLLYSRPRKRWGTIERTNSKYCLRFFIFKRPLLLSRLSASATQMLSVPTPNSRHNPRRLTSPTTVRF